MVSPAGSTSTVPTMPVHCPPEKPECRVQMNVQAPASPKVWETGGPPAWTMPSVTSKMSGPAGSGLPPGGTSQTLCGRKLSGSSKCQVTSSPTAIPTWSGSQVVPTALTSPCAAAVVGVSRAITPAPTTAAPVRADQILSSISLLSSSWRQTQFARGAVVTYSLIRPMSRDLPSDRGGSPTG